MQYLRQLIIGALVMICLATGVVLADSPYQVYVDGVKMELAAGVDPVEINNSILLPMRDLFERLGAKVVWDETSQKVFAVKDKLVMILPIDNDYAYFNGRSVRMTARAKLIGERTYVPLRFVSTIFGAGVNYDPVTKRIDITVAPKPISANGTQRLNIVAEAVYATRQVTSYTGEFNAQYTISLGSVAVPVELQAGMQVAGPDRFAFQYALSSAVKPDESVRGEVVAAREKLYIKAHGKEWVSQSFPVQGGEQAVVAGILAGLAGGDLMTLPLADMFGEVMLPKDDALLKMNSQGLIAGVDDLGIQDKNGRKMQGYHLTVDPIRFAYYYSNLAGLDPKAQGLVLDNVQALSLSTDYWISPDDKVIYETLIDLRLTMKPQPQSPASPQFALSMTERLTSINLPVEIVEPALTTN